MILPHGSWGGCGDVDDWLTAVTATKANYCASKAGLLHATRIMANEFLRHSRSPVMSAMEVRMGIVVGVGVTFGLSLCVCACVCAFGLFRIILAWTCF